MNNSLKNFELDNDLYLHNYRKYEFHLEYMIDKTTIGYIKDTSYSEVILSKIKNEINKQFVHLLEPYNIPYNDGESLLSDMMKNKKSKYIYISRDVHYDLKRCLHESLYNTKKINYYIHKIDIDNVIESDDCFIIRLNTPLNEKEYLYFYILSGDFNNLVYVDDKPKEYEAELINTMFNTNGFNMVNTIKYSWNVKLKTDKNGQ